MAGDLDRHGMRASASTPADRSPSAAPRPAARSPAARASRAPAPGSAPARPPRRAVAPARRDRSAPASAALVGERPDHGAHPRAAEEVGAGSPLLHLWRTPRERAAVLDGSLDQGSALPAWPDAVAPRSVIAVNHRTPPVKLKRLLRPTASAASATPGCHVAGRHAADGLRGGRQAALHSGRRVRPVPDAGHGDRGAGARRSLTGSGTAHADRGQTHLGLLVVDREPPAAHRRRRAPPAGRAAGRRPGGDAGCAGARRAGPSRPSSGAAGSARPGAVADPEHLGGLDRRDEPDARHRPGP